MATVTGTFDISSLMAVRFQSAAEYGLDTIERVLRADIAAHNEVVAGMVGDLCEMTTDRQRIYGSSADGEMQEVDEFSQAPSQRNLVGATVGFPMKPFQYNLGWTEKFLRRATPADVAQLTLAAEKAHLRKIALEIKKAIFLSANYSFSDKLRDKVVLGVKRFVNADGDPIPDGPNGETYDGSTHTHYSAHSGWDATALLAAINDIVEHGHGGQVRVAINRADEAAVAALTGFKAYADPRLVYRQTDTPGQTIDITRLDNRAIGLFGAAEVWVKPWAIDDYAFIWDVADPNKPLCYRQDTVQTLQGLRIAAENSNYPLFARFMEAEFGVGVWTRTNGGVHYIGAGSYADPSL